MKCAGESPSYRCVPPVWMCDGENHCGNNWDEDPAVCGEFSCFFVRLFDDLSVSI